jgi:prolyl-tRNA synthetase
LPLGLRTFKRIEDIIRTEMNKIGGQEIAMTALQSPEHWKKTGRWDDAVIDVWFKTNLKSGGELGLGTTHEEPVTALMSEYIESYKDLPRYVYQFQTKFRNELRAKSGIMRVREFVMKDLYSFSKDDADFRKFYEECAKAYETIFAKVGIGDRTYRTFASGGSFSKFSDEYQMICDAGEDVIYVSEAKRIAVNKEVHTDEILADIGLKKADLVEKKAIEVGNIFPLGTRFSDELGLTYKDETGAEIPVVMGCYGIGPGRLMGAIVEALADEKGLVWPKAVAPFSVHLISVVGKSPEVVEEANRIYEMLTDEGIEVLYDDRDARAGEKFADSDLIGVPVRLIVSEKTIAQGGVEIVQRKTHESTFVPESGILEYFEK